MLAQPPNRCLALDLPPSRALYVVGPPAFAGKIRILELDLPTPNFHKISNMVKSLESVRFGLTQRDQVNPTIALSAFMRDPTAGKVLEYIRDRPYNKGDRTSGEH